MRESHDLAFAKSRLNKPRINLSLSLFFQSSFHGFGLNPPNQIRPSFFLVQNVLNLQFLLLRPLDFFQLELFLFLLNHLILYPIQFLQLSLQLLNLFYLFILIANDANFKFSVFCSFLIQREHLVFVSPEHQLL